MEQKTEQMDKSVEIKTQNPNVEVSQSRNSQLVAKEKEPHSTHSFEWNYSAMKPIVVTCNGAGTAEDSLKQSPQFREIAKKNKGKELVIVRDGKPVSSHFPCSLIKDRLRVKYVKAVDKPKQQGRRPRRNGSPEDLVTFDVLTKGGDCIKKIMRNPKLRRDFEEMTVYAYKGDTVRQALRRDGRFLNVVFKKDSALCHKVTEVITEMSNLVDDLDGAYKIMLLSLRLPESQPSSLEDDITPNACQWLGTDENQSPSQQPTPTVSVNDVPDKEPKLCNTGPGIFFGKMSLQINNFMEGRKPVAKLSRIQNLLRVDYGKTVAACREVRTMKTLMGLSDSVCQVRVNGSPLGSGFLLFDNFVLTNGHVVKDLDSEAIRLKVQKLSVHFAFESLGKVGTEFEVEYVAGFEFSPEQMHDWALLKLRAPLTLPGCLLTRFGFCSQSNGICIIGHPDGGVKKIDPCLIIPSGNRNQAVKNYYNENQSHVQFVTPRFFEEEALSGPCCNKILTYNSCFYFGSSGSPVFDDNCRVVAMHSGGYDYKGPGGKTQSIIEFGYPLSDIMERIIIQLVEGGRWDVLKSYLACSYEYQHNVMSNVRKLVESRNLSAFKTAAIGSFVATDDKNLKTFFAFFCQTEQPVPMDAE